MKEILAKTSVIAVVITYTYMVSITAQGSGDELSLSTFVLWAMLAWITSFTMQKQGANPAVPMIYGVGATAITIVLLAKGKYEWTAFDTAVATLTFFCLVLLKTQGPRKALILSVIAATIAALPFIVMTWQKPAESPILANAGFLLTNVLAFASAKAWTLEDRLYSIVNTAVCSLLIIPWLMI